jgi:hypothetical protein
MPLKAVLGVGVLLVGLQVVVDRFLEEAALGVTHVMGLMELM